MTLNMTQPISCEVPATIAELRQALEAGGCFDYRPWWTVIAAIANVAAGLACFIAATRLPWPLAVPVFVAGSMLYYRLGWFMHDAAHGAVFATATANCCFAYVVGTVFGEFVSGWKYGHGLHHRHPNVRGLDRDKKERWDPALRFRTRTRAALNIFLLVRVYGLVLPRFGLLLLLRDGVYCWRSARRRFAFELALILLGHGLQIAFFVALAGRAGVWLYLAHHYIGIVYLNLVFAGNHYDLPNYEIENARTMPFDELQVRTARNYTDDLWTRFVCGGLEHQIEHHLFPSMPRRNFGRAAPLVRAYCEARGLPYECMPFLDATGRVLDYHVAE